MKVEFLFIGKTSEKYLDQGIETYFKRLKQYLPAAITVIPSDSNSANKRNGMIRESESILKKIQPKDFVILLDEKGKEYNSVQLAQLMNRSMIHSVPKIIFIVGGAYGIGEAVSSRANLVLSFSRFTMTHQMIRIFLLEQIYRAMTILHNEPYHHS